MNPKLKSLFDKSRQELLDMGLRGNTLLSLNKNARVLDIVDEKSTQVFDTLVHAQKAMSFAPVPTELDKDEGEDLPISELREHLERRLGNKRHEDNSLQTSLFKKALENKLVKLHSEALTYVQEQGVDLLYLAIGFIKWYEDDSSDKARYAPLVLVPVELSRANAVEAYKIRYTDAELGANLTLAAKFKMEFNIILPSFEEQEDGYALSRYFDDVEKAISKEKRWSVASDKIALSFFSFGKFQMFQDLADEIWPDGKKPCQHPVINKLFGEGFESDTALLHSTPMNVSQVEDIHLVLDSDSSQTEAVLAAKTGANLVIQGPPGTGKSQTITNIISQALADDKKVLFVAEKMAALEVVKRRLDNCCIGDAVLELHSHKANKKAVLTSLETALMQYSPVSPERGEDIEKLVSLRSKLDEYCSVINEGIGQTGISYQVALGYALKYENSLNDNNLDQGRLPEIALDINTWTASHINRSIAKVQELVDYLTHNGAPRYNLFSSTNRLEVSPEEAKAIGKLCQELRKLQTQFVDDVSELAISLGFEHHANTFTDAAKALKTLRFIAEKPNLQGLNLSSEAWIGKQEQILKFAHQGVSLQQYKGRLSQHFLPQAFESDWMSTRGILTTTGTKWWRFLSGDYRKAKASYAGMCRQGLTGTNAEWLQQIDGLLDLKSDLAKFATEAGEVITVIGEHYKNEQTDWSKLHQQISWISQAYNGLEFNSLDASITKHISSASAPVTTAEIDALVNLEVQREQCLNQLSIILELNEPCFTELVNKLEPTETLRLEEDIEKIYELARFNRLTKQLNDVYLELWGELAYSWSYDPNLLLAGFKLKLYSALINHHYDVTPLIRQFDRTEHEKAIEQFSDIDSRLFHFAQEQLVEKLYSRLPNPAARGEVETLRREFNKKRRQMPIRRLINRAGRAIQQIKPVFMMSPMSIATYLEPGAIDFDLVIFDEASQVKVADALGAILRGQQVIVVGDTKQMPPTSFFGKMLLVDDQEAEESATADIESILGMFLAAGTPETMLKWHYRSRHESLIAVSNQEFYDNKLMIFPSSGINPSAKGLRLNHLPKATYDRGGSRSNKAEATAVAEAVMIHALTSPGLTLGVVAFSTAQRDAIMLEVERLRKQSPETEAFFAPHEEGEDFFIKNLENVQGDERDIIFISIGYGKTTEGRLPMSFGPLNNEGGERRLNVLISRSRMCMEVFCNFKAIEMPTTDSSPFGVRALKNFLHYAETKELITRDETGKSPDSPFEEEVISVIRGLGYSVEPQVGCAGFYIDIAVRDVTKSGRYMLAVECDGATYHSSRSARDRDRIRQSVLEGLGWRFHRIWSTDWFRNRHIETARLSDALKEAVAYYQHFDEQESSKQPSKKSNKAKAQIQRIAVEQSNSKAEYTSCDLKELLLYSGQAIPEVPFHKLTRDVMTVLKAESPIHSKLLTLRLLQATGASRAGSKITRTVNDVLAHLNRSSEIVINNDFVKTVGTEVIVRNRSKQPNNERKFDYVPCEEIAIAAIECVEETFSIEHDELVKSITETLGFSVTSKPMKDRVEAIITNHVKRQVLTDNGGVYTVKS